jgi:hypothetical protein
MEELFEILDYGKYFVALIIPSGKMFSLCFLVDFNR